MNVTSMVRTKASLIWLLLCALTVLSWALGTNLALGDGHHLLANMAIFAVAIFKMRLVGLYFMELKTAPRALRGLFEGYCVGLFVLLAAVFALA